MTLIALKERKRELEVKRQYAFEKYVESESTHSHALKTMKRAEDASIKALNTIQQADKELFEIEMKLRLAKGAK